MIYIKHGPVLMKQDDEVEYIYFFLMTIGHWLEKQHLLGSIPIEQM